MENLPKYISLSKNSFEVLRQISNSKTINLQLLFKDNHFLNFLEEKEIWKQQALNIINFIKKIENCSNLENILELIIIYYWWIDQSFSLSREENKQKQNLYLPNNWIIYKLWTKVSNKKLNLYNLDLLEKVVYIFENIPNNSKIIIDEIKLKLNPNYIKNLLKNINLDDNEIEDFLSQVYNTTIFDASNETLQNWLKYINSLRTNENKTSITELKNYIVKKLEYFNSVKKV